LTVPQRLLGRRVLTAEDVTRPWASAVRTHLLKLDDGSRVVLQSGRPTVAGRAGIARRIRLGRTLRRVQSGLPVPEVLAGDARAPEPFLVARFVAGSPGDALLATPGGAAELGRLAGSLAAEIGRVPGNGLRLSRLWADPDRLRIASERWLVEAGPLLEIGVASQLDAVVRRAPGIIAAAPPVVSHGDLAPVNILFADGRVTALLDLERMRLAPPLFDTAWFRFVVRHHHPGSWPDVWPAFLAARGLDEGTERGERDGVLDDLAALACLEQIAAQPRRSPGRREWAARAAEVVHASGVPVGRSRPGPAPEEELPIALRPADT
jgi:prepilin-type processing-associated H-X9-DG protein